VDGGCPYDVSAPGVQDSKSQVTALQLMTGTLQRTTVFGTENRDTLTHKATGVSLSGTGTGF
jgi:hypothetical protein